MAEVQFVSWAGAGVQKAVAAGVAQRAQECRLVGLFDAFGGDRHTSAWAKAMLSRR